MEWDFKKTEKPLALADFLQHEAPGELLKEYYTAVRQGIDMLLPHVKQLNVFLSCYPPLLSNVQTPVDPRELQRSLDEYLQSFDSLTESHLDNTLKAAGLIRYLLSHKPEPKQSAA